MGLKAGDEIFPEDLERSFREKMDGPRTVFIVLGILTAIAVGMKVFLRLLLR